MHPKISGRADIYPLQVRAGSAGNTMNLVFEAGNDVDDYTILKVTIPEGWSRPSLNSGDKGYFTVAAEEAKLTSSDIRGNTIILELFGLKPGSSRVRIKYGDKSRGGQGATASGLKGTDVFRVESAVGRDAEAGEIETSPEIEKT